MIIATVTGSMLIVSNRYINATRTRTGSFPKREAELSPRRLACFLPKLLSDCKIRLVEAVRKHADF